MIHINSEKVEISGTFPDICKEYTRLTAHLVANIKENKPLLKDKDDDEVLYFILRAGAEMIGNEQKLKNAVITHTETLQA